MDSLAVVEISTTGARLAQALTARPCAHSDAGYPVLQGYFYIATLIQ